MPPTPAISVIIPIYNEAASLADLANEINTALKGVCHEMIFVDDASTDDSLDRLRALKTKYQNLRILSHEKNAGQSRALHSGILAARKAIIATLDGDGQNDPADILSLYRQLTRQGAPLELALIGGVRQNRQDSLNKRLASKCANTIRHWCLKDSAQDAGSGLKLFYRKAFLALPFFDHMHRFMPALMQREGLLCEYHPIRHRPRLNGYSKYNNICRLWVSIADILGLIWLQRRARSPQKTNEL